MKVLFGLLAVALALAALPVHTGDLTVSASCGADCQPAAHAFEVPDGQRASGFRILSMRPGAPCSGGGEKPMAGFSIRRGSDTVLVYYTGPSGTVSDPVPLENLSLEPGRYALLAVPARGASIALSITLLAAKE